MYTEYFGFRENPFNATPDPRFYYANSTLSRVTSRILAGIQEHKGFIVLTGEVGTGKTTLLRKLMSDLHATVNFAFFYTTTLSFDGLLSFVCHDLGLKVESRDRSQKILALKEFLLTQLDQGRSTVILVDEAQNLTERTLEQLQALLALEDLHGKLLQIVLVGQPELQNKLDHPRLHALRAQIAVQCQLDRLKDAEVGPFIRYRVAAAGCDRQDLFAQEAIERIAVYSNGIPRLINIISDNALLMTYAESRKTVSAAMIDTAARDLGLKAKCRVIELTKPEVEQVEPAKDKAVSPTDRLIIEMKKGWARLSVQSASVWMKQAVSYRQWMSTAADPKPSKIEEMFQHIHPTEPLRQAWLKSLGLLHRIYSGITAAIVLQPTKQIYDRWVLCRHRPKAWVEIAVVMSVFVVLWGGRRAIYYPQAGELLQADSHQGESQPARVVTAPELGFAVLGRGAQDPNRSLASLVQAGEAYFPELQTLYERELASEPWLMGSLVLDLIIEPDGKLSHVDFLSAKVKSRKLRAAVSELVRTWRFSSASGPVRVRYPVLFIPPGIDAASIVAWEKNVAEVKTQLAASKPERYLPEVTEPGKYKVVLPTYVRSRPRDDAEIITSLRPPIKVWIERVMGKYMEVLALPGQRIRGYIHQQDAFLTPAE